MKKNKIRCIDCSAKYFGGIVYTCGYFLLKKQARSVDPWILTEAPPMWCPRLDNPREYECNRCHDTGYYTPLSPCIEIMADGSLKAKQVECVCQKTENNNA